MCGFFIAPAQASKGLDTSLRPTLSQYRAIHAAGYEFVGRYLPIPGGSKIYPVTKVELANARQAGVDLFMIFEWCDWTHYPTSYRQGAIDARIAKNALKVLGLPSSTVVYFSLDRGNASIRQATLYFRGIRAVLGTSRYVGCYGSKEQLVALKSYGLIRYLWHARWMDNNPMPLTWELGWGCTMYQSTALRWVGGVPCDQNWTVQ